MEKKPFFGHTSFIKMVNDCNERNAMSHEGFSQVGYDSVEDNEDQKKGFLSMALLEIWSNNQILSHNEA